MEVDIRVRPALRHSITRYTRDGNNSGVETLCEVANERYAEEIMEALRVKNAPKTYSIIQRSFDVMVMVVYADELEQAARYKEQLEKFYHQEFRIYEREITDPVKLAAWKIRNPDAWDDLILPLTVGSSK